MPIVSEDEVDDVRPMQRRLLPIRRRRQSRLSYGLGYVFFKSDAPCKPARVDPFFTSKLNQAARPALLVRPLAKFMYCLETVNHAISWSLYRGLWTSHRITK